MQGDGEERGGQKRTREGRQRREKRKSGKEGKEGRGKEGKEQKRKGELTPLNPGYATHGFDHTGRLRAHAVTNSTVLCMLDCDDDNDDDDGDALCLVSAKVEHAECRIRVSVVTDGVASSLLPYIRRRVPLHHHRA